MGNKLRVPQEEKINTIKIHLQDLEELHQYFQKNGTRDDMYLWYMFLCQKPEFINVDIQNNKIIEVTKERIPATMRFINYMYDIEWDPSFTKNEIEESKDFVRFWISDNVCDIWESLIKVMPQL